MRGNSVMSGEKTVLFLTDPDDSLAREFSLALAREFEAKYDLSFLYAVDVHANTANTDWCIGWVCDDNGQVQACLNHLRSGHSHFLGTDPQQAIRAACRLIRQWDTETLAVQ
jgi:hypothetical protein